MSPPFTALQGNRAVDFRSLASIPGLVRPVPFRVFLHRTFSKLSVSSASDFILVEMQQITAVW
jgi:hypothetical protein